MTSNEKLPEDDAPLASPEMMLRQRAEAAFLERAVQSPEHPDALSPEATQPILHELRVHQIELEMQNEELRRAQVELDASRAGYFDLYHLAPVSYCSLSEQGLILQANLTAATQLGVARGALFGQPLSRFIHKEDGDNYHLLRKKLMETGEPQSCELRMVRNDGTQFWAHLASTVTQDADGLPVIRVVMSDVTERKLLQIQAEHAEEEIRQLNASLEQRVRERTAQLEAAVRELDAFSYSVSHDLRAPLRAVDGFSRIVSKDYGERLDDEGRRMLGVIRRGAQRMGRLIDDLLAFSRLGRQQIEPVPIDMHALAQAVFDELAALDPERKLRLDLHPLPPARGTQAMIRQVWANLIGNAIKFTTGREVGEIEIGAREGGDGGQIYYVKDNGAGFDMRYVAKLFGVFQRLHSAAEFPGTGVGLALVQRIVQRHGGRVWAEAELKKGATFYFTIPNPKR